ncbi:hypothetical protein ACFLY2_02625 [Patescibacteria group bacterium]
MFIDSTSHQSFSTKLTAAKILPHVASKSSTIAILSQALIDFFCISNVLHPYSNS